MQTFTMGNLEDTISNRGIKIDKRTSNAQNKNGQPEHKSRPPSFHTIAIWAPRFEWNPKQPPPCGQYEKLMASTRAPTTPRMLFLLSFARYLYTYMLYTFFRVVLYVALYSRLLSTALSGVGEWKDRSEFRHFCSRLSRVVVVGALDALPFLFFLRVPLLFISGLLVFHVLACFHNHDALLARA